MRTMRCFTCVRKFTLSWVEFSSGSSCFFQLFPRVLPLLDPRGRLGGKVGSARGRLGGKVGSARGRLGGKVGSACEELEDGEDVSQSSGAGWPGLSWIKPVRGGAVVLELMWANIWWQDPVRAEWIWLPDSIQLKNLKHTQTDCDHCWFCQTEV